MCPSHQTIMTRNVTKNMDSNRSGHANRIRESLDVWEQYGSLPDLIDVLHKVTLVVRDQQDRARALLLSDDYKP